LTQKSEKIAELKVAEIREVWPLKTMLELSQRIVDKGVIKGNKVILSAKDRKKLLSYRSKIEPILARIKRSKGAEAEPIERAIHAWREKMQYFSRQPGRDSK
jgi:L-rhamnose isomerase